jgi:hypothetical protein
MEVVAVIALTSKSNGSKEELHVCDGDGKASDCGLDENLNERESDIN